jgi:hypothetical protein
MTTTIQFNGVSFAVSASLVSSGVPFPYEKNSRPQHNKYRVSVVCNNIRRSFSYFDSVANYMANKKELSESDLKEAFYCFVSDSVSGENSFEDFCSEFGYDSDSRTAEKIWRACGRSYGKLKSLLPPDVDIYDLLNYLIDLENAG